jgi:hypothetical protein
LAASSEAASVLAVTSTVLIGARYPSVGLTAREAMNRQSLRRCRSPAMRIALTKRTVKVSFVVAKYWRWRISVRRFRGICGGAVSIGPFHVFVFFRELPF